MWKRTGTWAAVITLLMMTNGTSARGQGTDHDISLYVRSELCRDIASGSRVRLIVGPNLETYDPRLPGETNTLTGTLVACRDGFLVLRPGGSVADSVLVPVTEVHSMEVSRGKSQFSLPGAMLGLLVGVVISYNVQTHNHEDEFLGELEDAQENITRGAGISILTTIIGGVVGAAVAGENWTSVYDLQSVGSVGRGRSVEYQVAVGFSF